MNEHTRLHALDNLRAIMMWLGIVLHVAVIYTVTPGLFPFHDRHTTVAADLLTVLIHAFRMPVFFIMAGLFAALLTARDGYGGMLRNRLRRIGLPFALFWFPLFVGVGMAFMLFGHVIRYGTLGIDQELMKLPAGSAPRSMYSTMHLWFMYYLLIFYAIAALLGNLGVNGQGIGAAAARLGRAWWGPALLALPAMLVGFSHPGGIAPTRTSFIPWPDELIHNGLYFAFGWFLYRHRELLLAHYAKYCWRYLGAGLAALVGYLVAASWAVESSGKLPLAAGLVCAYAYGWSGWLLSFSLIGLFARYLRHAHPWLTYLARSSYWVYLLHFPLTVAIGALLYRLDAAAPLKMVINIGATTALCLLSYHLLVRATWIGRLLGGSKRGAGAPVGPAHSPVV